MDSKANTLEHTFPNLILFKDARSRAKWQKLNNPVEETKQAKNFNMAIKKRLENKENIQNSSALKKRASSLNSEEKKTHKFTKKKCSEDEGDNNQFQSSNLKKKVVIRRDPKENKWKNRVEKSKSTCDLHGMLKCFHLTFSVNACNSENPNSRIILIPSENTIDANTLNFTSYAIDDNNGMAFENISFASNFNITSNINSSVLSFNTLNFKKFNETANQEFQQQQNEILEYKSKYELLLQNKIKELQDKEHEIASLQERLTKCIF